MTESTVNELTIIADKPRDNPARKYGRPLWGPVQWAALHNIAFGAPVTPDDTTPDYYAYFCKLAEVLPCSCSKHAIEYCKENPIKTRDRTSLTKWVFDFHNAVNKRIGKPLLEEIPNDWLLPPRKPDWLLYCTIALISLICGLILARFK